LRKSVKYWKWNESLNLTPYKLGINIDDLVSKKIVTRHQQKYLSVDENISSIDVVDGKIKAIFFDDEFELLHPKNIWDFKIDEFVDTINGILIPANFETKGDILLVLFRGGFVSFFGIIRKE